MHDNVFPVLGFFFIFEGGGVLLGLGWGFFFGIDGVF